MKKIQLAEEAGRSMAMKRYGKIDAQSKHGHSQMGHNVKSKFQMQTGGGTSGPSGYVHPLEIIGPPEKGDVVGRNVAARQIKGVKPLPIPTTTRVPLDKQEWKRGGKAMARGGGIPTKTDYGDPVGAPGDTDKDFSDMESEDAAVSVRVRPDQNAGFSRSIRQKGR